MYKHIQQHCFNQYSVIALDPPWQYSDKSLNRIGAERHYRTLSLAQLAQLPIDQMGAKNSALWMWTTGPFMPHAINLMRHYGYNYVNTGIVWRKLNRLPLTDKALQAALGANREIIHYEGQWYTPFMGAGHWMRTNEEFMIFGHRGRMTRASASERVSLSAPVGEHSAKPDEAYHRIERLYTEGDRLELFARKARAEWKTWGDQI